MAGSKTISGKLCRKRTCISETKTKYDCLEIFRYDWNLRNFIIRYLRKKIKIAQNGHNTIYEERKNKMCVLFVVDTQINIP